jgi:signal transduction histidine kinase
MTLRARLLSLSLATVAVVVVALTALHLNTLITVWLDQAQERSDVAARQLQSFILKRIELRTAALKQAPATLAEAKRAWAAMLRDDSELPLMLEQTMVQSHSIVEIEVANENGLIVVSSNPAQAGRPLSPRQDLTLLRHASAFDRVVTILQSHSDYETRVPLGISGQERPVFQIQVLVSPVLLRGIVEPELEQAGVAGALSLLLAVALAYFSARIALQPLVSVERLVDRLLHGDDAASIALEDRELAALQSKLNLLGAQVHLAKRDANEIRGAMHSLARGVAHEFKNPLNAIMLRLELLRTRLAPAPPEAAADLEILSSEVTRLDRVVRNFLDLSRPVEMNLQRLDGDALAGDLLELVRPEAERHGVRLELSRADAPVTLFADADLLKQALLNVVKNAIEAVEPGGSVTLAVCCVEGNGEIAVVDTGSGMSEEVRARIFDPYFTTKARGSGIGLALARRILQLHGGSVEVESRVGQGTTFRLRVPLAAREEVS